MDNLIKHATTVDHKTELVYLFYPTQSIESRRFKRLEHSQ